MICDDKEGTNIPNIVSSVLDCFVTTGFLFSRRERRLDKEVDEPDNEFLRVNGVGLGYGSTLDSISSQFEIRIVLIHKFIQPFNL